MSSDPTTTTNPQADILAASILVERERIIAERAEDARLEEAGEPPVIRDNIPTERIPFVRAAEAQLDAEAAEAAAAAAETQRTSNLERIATLQAELQVELEFLCSTTVAGTVPTPEPTTSSSSTRTGLPAGIDPSRVVIPDLLYPGVLPGTAGFSSPIHDLIGMSDFLATERSDTELEHSSMQVVSKADRLKLSASNKSKIYTSFIKGSTNKFKATSTIVGLDEISTIENITSFAELRLELQRHITSISVHPVFLILKFDSDGQLIDPDSVEGSPTNLLSVNSLPPLSDVERSVPFHYKRGSAFNQENLVWSLEAVRNSCNKDLHRQSSTRRCSSTRRARHSVLCTTTS